MSQYPPPQDPSPDPNPFARQQSFEQPMHQPYQQPPRKENAVGLTGFIVSLVGLFLCGIPSLIGLGISAVGLRKEPRGLAIAGVILGLIGLIELGIIGTATYQGFRAAQQGFTQIKAQLAEVQLDQAAADIGAKWQEQDRIPTQEEGDEMMIGRNDMMNNSLVYETDGTSFSIRSAGGDGILETEDDIVVGPFEDPQTAIDLSPNFEDWEDEDWGDMESDGDLSSQPDEASSEDGAPARDLMLE